MVNFLRFLPFVEKIAIDPSTFRSIAGSGCELVEYRKNVVDVNAANRGEGGENPHFSSRKRTICSHFLYICYTLRHILHNNFSDQKRKK